MIVLMLWDSVIEFFSELHFVAAIMLYIYNDCGPMNYYSDSKSSIWLYYDSYVLVKARIIFKIHWTEA